MSRRANERQNHTGDTERTTALRVDWQDLGLIDARYDIIRITDSESKGSYYRFVSISDPVGDPLSKYITGHPIRAVKYVNGRGEENAVYMLLDKRPENWMETLEYVRSKGDTLKRERITAAELYMKDERTLLGLLLNASQTDDVDEYRYNNLNGSFWITNGKWVRKKRITVLEASIQRFLGRDHELYVSFRAKSLGRLSSFKGDDYAVKAKRPRYRLVDGVLRRAFDAIGKDDFVEGKPFGSGNASVPFLDLSDKESYRVCKIRLFDTILRDVNRMFSGIVEITPMEMDIVREIQPAKDDISAFEMELGRKISETGFTLSIGDAGDPDEIALMEDVRIRLHDLFGIVPENDAIDPVPGKFNLRVIHDADYYRTNGIADPYIRSGDTVVQHLTVEDFGSDDDPLNDGKLYNVLMKELFIKDGITQRRDIVGHWEDRRHEGDYIFLRRVDFGTIKRRDFRIFSLTMHSDGSFGFGELNRSNDCSGLIEDVWPEIDRPDGCEHAIIHDGSIASILNTGVVPSVDIDVLDQAFRDKKGRGHGGDGQGPKGYRTRDRTVYNILDLKLLEHGGDRFYLCGYNGFNIPQKQHNAPNIRSIRCSGEDFFEEILGEMNVPFVRYGQLTVFPYPFKYLNEYIRSIRPSDQDGGESDQGLLEAGL